VGQSTQHHRFFLPALLCQSVCAALVRPAQVPGSYIASASQVLVSALERRHGRYAVSFGVQRSRTGYHAHRRALCANGMATSTTAFAGTTACWFGQLARRSTAMPRPLASARFRIVLVACSTAVGDPQLRQNYITPHCPQCPPVSRRAPFVAATASRPAGESNRRYAKLPSLERSSAVGVPRSLRALHAVACRPCGVLAPWH